MFRNTNFEFIVLLPQYSKCWDYSKVPKAAEVTVQFRVTLNWWKNNLSFLQPGLTSINHYGGSRPNDTYQMATKFQYESPEQP